MRSREWIPSLHPLPSHPSHNLRHKQLSDETRMYTRNLLYSWSCKKPALLPKLLICSQSYHVTSLITKCLKNINLISLFSTKLPYLQLYPHSQWNRNSFKRVGLADSPAVKCYRKFFLLQAQSKMPCV